MKHLLYILLALMLTPLIATSREADNNANRKKAQYIFLEAQRQKQLDRYDAYFDLLRHAYEIDSTNTDVAFYLGYSLLHTQPTQPVTEKALQMMKSHFIKAPYDLYETTTYADACLLLNKPEDALHALRTLCKHYPNKIELQSRLATAQSRSGDFKSAIETYDSIEALHGKSRTLAIRKAGNYFQLRDTTAGLDEIRSLLAEAPDNVDNLVFVSAVLSQFGEKDSALYYLDRAQQLEPDNGIVYQSKAQYYHLIGDSTAYEQHMRQALMSENLEIEDKMEMLLEYTRNLMKEGDSTGRIDTLMNVLIFQHPHQPEVRELYSEYLVAEQRIPEAIEQINYALDVQPTNEDMWRKLMILNMMNEDYPHAIAAAEKALEYNPDNISLYRYIAPSYLQMKQYDKAIKTYNKALELADTNDIELRSDLYAGIGDVLHETGDTAQAYQNYEHALELNPLNTGAMNNYAYFLALAETDLDKAERMAALAVKEQPTNPTFLDTYAWVFFKKKDYVKALLYIKAAFDNEDQPSVDLLEHYGDILFVNGETEQALEQWRKALMLEPDNKSIQQKINRKSID